MTDNKERRHSVAKNCKFKEFEMIWMPRLFTQMRAAEY